jgi:DnaK suppressor protein
MPLGFRHLLNQDPISLGVPMADEVDRANDLFEDRRNVEIKTISRQLERKNFDGICDECGDDIDPRRLAALPSARHCIQCKEGLEVHSRLHRN